jgi:Predicted membrane protein (DUF2339)
MSASNQQLLEYIKEQVKSGIPLKYVKKALLDNDWQEEVINQAFAELSVSVESSTNDFNKNNTDKSEDPFAREGITMDKIIEKFIPIAGALLLIIGFGYLIYANAWVNLPMEIRIGLGFFFSVVIIGGAFSLPEKMRYFTDIGIGSGVLLLYGTLMYGSRTTELATAMIPEAATLFTAALFTIAVAYFASKRSSKAILILGMPGAYLTPFVVGQNDIWVQNVSFNAYLIYFFAVNVAVFLVGREISVRDIIPLNIVGLFAGISTLWSLSMSDSINVVRPGNLLTGELFTAILFAVLVVFSIWSILLSAKKFNQNDDGFLSLGYIAPVIWFAFNINNLDTINDVVVGILYALIAASCFVGWHTLKGTETKFQHTALYAAGLISALLAVFAFFQEFDVFTSMLIAYTSLIFGILHIFDSGKSERFASYIIVSFIGSLLSLGHIVDAHSQYETLLIVVALLPAMSAYFIAKNGSNQELVPPAKLYSILWSIIALMFVLGEFIDYIDAQFLLFYLAPLLFLGYLAYVNTVSPDSISLDSRSRMFRLTMFWFAFGFVSTFFTLVFSIYPAPTDVRLFTDTGTPTDWVLIKGVFGTIILFLGLSISRRLQLEQVIKRPSFILVIFGFSSLLLIGNYIISAIANDLQVSLEHGGPRAIATTLWWAAIAIYMLYKGIKLGKKYHSEKLLGLLLLGITLVKIILYDIVTMGMQNKIIVMMVVGGLMLLFSYQIQSKNLLKKNVPEVQ